MQLEQIRIRTLRVRYACQCAQCREWMEHDRDKFNHALADMLRNDYRAVVDAGFTLQQAAPGLQAVGQNADVVDQAALDDEVKQAIRRNGPAWSGQRRDVEVIRSTVRTFAMITNTADAETNARDSLYRHIHLRCESRRQLRRQARG